MSVSGGWGLYLHVDGSFIPVTGCLCYVGGLGTAGLYSIAEVFKTLPHGDTTAAPAITTDTVFAQEWSALQNLEVDVGSDLSSRRLVTPCTCSQSGQCVQECL